MNDKKRIEVGYKFDKTLRKLKLENMWPPLDVLETIYHLLTVIESMHFSCVFHGSLAEDESYVYRNNNTTFHIINPKHNGTNFDDLKKDHLKETDLNDFLSFLINHNVRKLDDQGNVDANWELFELFSWLLPGLNINCLINHLVFKNSVDKLSYYQIAYDCVGRRRQERMHDTDFDTFWRGMDNFWNIYCPWDAKLMPGSKLLEAYTTTPMGGVVGDKGVKPVKGGRM